MFGGDDYSRHKNCHEDKLFGYAFLGPSADMRVASLPLMNIVGLPEAEQPVRNLRVEVEGQGSDFVEVRRPVKEPMEVSSTQDTMWAGPSESDLLILGPCIVSELRRGIDLRAFRRC